MNSTEIRQKFLDYFKKKEHQIVQSAPLVVKDDPTLMFTNAGMNQFKEYFLGTKQASQKRVADTQKCLRVSGKHNDLEEVGIDTYHHTMFEMLGNWSFGDYFKKEAIEWGWELLTDVFKLPKDRMYASIFGGDKHEKLEEDKEAYSFWSDILPAERILYGSKKDNFWEMGDTGPCGPSSEIHIDLRSEEERKKVPGKDLVNQDHPLVIEIWNLVFIQFNRKADGTLENLPEKHVDTGMGFERLVMAIQGKTSNYDTDVFQPLIQRISQKAKVIYGETEYTDIAIRVISDHVRAVAFAIADDQLPSNTGAGYVIRRILRRAVRYGYSVLGLNEPFIFELVEILSDQLGLVFPEIKQQQEFISKVIQEEEQSFLKTLDKGLRIFDDAHQLVIRQDQKDKEGKTQLSGSVAFKLYDTYGFPIDLTLLMAREKGISVDMEGFEAEMVQQKDRSRSAGAKDQGDWTILQDTSEVEFVGYTALEADSKILRYRELTQKGKKQYQIVLDKTPFYAESGGQVGDRGYLISGQERISIIDTQKEHDLIVHLVNNLPSDPELAVHCVVDEKKRRLTENNHSSTHLLHAALRQVLGNHVQQKGSLVNEKGLRFDFSHFAKLTEEELEEIEQIVNERIRENIKLDERKHVPIDEAKKMGAMALFGEKYGNFVRVIVFNPSYSVELCGGTHVPSTGNIGLFKITSESSIAAGVRRIEAITSETAELYVNKQLKTLQTVKGLFNNPKDIVKVVNDLVDEKNKLVKEIDKYQGAQAQNVKKELVDSLKKENGVSFIVKRISLPNADALKKLSFELKNELSNVLIILAAEINGKPQISVMISEELIAKYELNAGNIVRELAKEIKGGGGGQPFFATAGGKDLNGLDQVIVRANEIIGSLDL
jgi:alanyl-tRNA synthetase